MSYSAMHWARGIKTGSSTLKAVLYAIANYADEEGLAWPSQKRLADDTELSERAVRNALATLEDMGIIDRQGRRGDKQTYKTDLIRLIMRPAAYRSADDEPAARRSGGPEESVSEPAAPGSRASGTSFQNQRHDVPPNLSVEPSVESPEGETRVREAHAASPSPTSVSEAFELFWKTYPQKVGKGAAQASFVRVMKSKKVDFETLMAGLKSYCNKTDDRPWCNPATWLNQARWLDEPIAGNEPKKPAAQVRRMAI